MIKTKFQHINIEAVQGDITKQPDVIAIVNAANVQLKPGGGVAGAIHKAAGPELEEECRSLAPIKPGEAVTTGAYNLPNKYVIHCLGPVYGQDKPGDKLLADCYRHTLKLADTEGIDSIAFPAISTGSFGYPKETACTIALNTIDEIIHRLLHVTTIRFVLFSEDDLNLYEKRLTQFI